MSTNEPRSTSTQKQWLIKFDKGQIKGPYSTDAVIKLISEGVVLGHEAVAIYPNQIWEPIEKKSEFYEALMEALENPYDRDEKKVQKMEAETVIRVMKTENESVKENPSLNENDDEYKPAANLDDLNKLLAASKRKENELNDTAQVSSMGNTLSVQKKINLAEEQKKLQNDAFTTTENKVSQLRQEFIKKWGIKIAAGLIVAAGFFIFLNSESDEKNANAIWTLKAPQFAGTQNEDIAANAAEKKKAIALLRTGVVDHFNEAQSHLIQALENKNNDLESMGLLCAVHNLMWPYTNQKISDLKVIAKMAQQARTINPISTYSEVCQTVFLISKGQISDAVAVLSRAINTGHDAPLILPFLYEIRGSLFEDAENYLSAESYYAEASRLFPGWMWPMLNGARMMTKAGKAESISAYKNILQSKPNYKAGLYGAAIAHLKINNDKELALSYLEQGFEIDNKLPRNFHLEALREYVNLLIEKNNKEQALVVAKQGLKISPKDKTMKDIVLSLGGELNSKVDAEVVELIQTGDQYFRSGDLAAAQAQYRAAFILDSSNTALILKISKCLWQLRQSREAMSWIDKAIQVDPKLTTAYTLKADYFIARFNFVEAEKALQTVQKYDPQNFEMLKSFALLEFKKNNLIAAEQMAEKAYKQYNADIELLALMANIGESLYFQMKANGANEEKLKNVKDNVKKYASKAVDLEPHSALAQVSYAKFIHIAEGSYRSELYLKELIKNFQYNIEYRLALAELFELDEKFKSALEQYIPLSNLDPKNYKAKFGMARCYKNMNEYELAQKYYLEAALLDYNNAEPLFALAVLQLDKGILKKDLSEVKRSLTKFEKVSQINPNYPKTYYYIARSYFELSQYDKAQENIKIEKLKNPNLADSYVLLGALFGRLNQFKDCATEYAQGAKLRVSAEFYLKSAECYRKGGDLDMAEFMINEASKINRNLPDVMKELGYFYKAKGDSAEARKNFQLYLEHSPNAVDRNEIEKMMY